MRSCAHEHIPRRPLRIPVRRAGWLWRVACMVRVADEKGERMNPTLTEEAETQEAKQSLKKINVDQVSWIMNALDRLVSVSQQNFPMASRMTKATKLSALLEIMEVLGYEFEDSAAAGNALSAFWEFNKMRGGDR